MVLPPAASPSDQCARARIRKSPTQVCTAGSRLFLHEKIHDKVQRLGAEEEPSGDVDVRRRRIPFLPRGGVGIENCPDRATAVVSIAYSGERSKLPCV
jgi:hypothetical protein